MADDLAQLEEWVGALLANIAPGERRQLAMRIATDLRRSQQQRIAAQRNPDGSAYVPRKNPMRDRRGRIRQGKLFSKIRQARYLKKRATPGAATVGFTGRVSRIATVHQHGLRDRVRRDSPTEVRYPSRALLGFTEADRQHVLEQIMEAIRPE